MKIVHIISGLNAGGAEKMLSRLTEALDSHQHIIVSLSNVGSVGRFLLSRGFQVYDLELKRKNIVFALWKLWQLLRQSQPDVVQTWMYHADIIGGVVARLAGIRNVVWNIRNTEIPQNRYSLTALIIKACIVCSYFVPKKIICCANSAMTFHIALGYCKSRMQTIPNGISIQNFAIPTRDKIATRVELGLPVNTIIVGIVGRYDFLKGYDVFVKAAGLLATQCLNRIVFLMVGRGVDESNVELTQLVNEFGGGADFIYFGERHDIEKVMFSIDVFCLSSRAEGFPNVVVEAMLMKVPCVVTDVGDAKEIVGTSGIVVPPENPLNLAVAISSVVSLAEGVRIELGQSARRRIKENYSIESIANQYENLYLSLDKA